MLKMDLQFFSEINSFGKIIGKYSDLEQLAKNTSPSELIKYLEKQGWKKEVQPGGRKSGPATIFIDPNTGMVARIHASPGKEHLTSECKISQGIILTKMVTFLLTLLEKN